MSYIKTLVCLANSRKTSGRCVAGKEVKGSTYGGWIRPISKRQTAEISEEDRRYKDGSYPEVLDIIRITMLKPCPLGFQTENHLIDDQYYWQKDGTANIGDVRKNLDVVKGALWDNSSSSAHGRFDRVREDKAKTLKNSLVLVEVPALTISVFMEGPKRKVRGRFSLDGIEYKLAVTDPNIEKLYFKKEDGEYAFGKALLCISLGEPFNGFAYKLIATVLKPSR